MPGRSSWPPERDRRLAPVTRVLYGEDRPKQSAVLSGTRSLLQTTIDRLGERHRREHTVVAVAEEHASLAYRHAFHKHH